MKQLCLCMLFAIIYSHALAQQVTPLINDVKNYQEVKKWERKKTELVNIQSSFLKSITMNKSVDSTSLDSISSLEKEITKSDSILAMLKDDVAFVVFSASSSLNSSEELKSYSGSSRVFASLQLAKPLSVTIAYNLAAVKPQSVSRDSIDLIALMFPEAGTTGFAIGSNILITSDNKAKKNDITNSLSGFAEFSFKQTKYNSTYIDSSGKEVEDGTKEFSALNYTLGVKYQYIYRSKTNKENPVVFGTSVYVNFFNIPDEDEDNFELAIQDSFTNNSSITSVGAKFTLQYKGYILFGDFRNNFSTDNFSDNNAFKGFVYNIGTLINADLFKL